MFIPTSSESSIIPVTFVQSKNWFKFFEEYETIPVVVSLYVTDNSPEFGNPTVESTSKIVVPAETCPINLVFGNRKNGINALSA